MSDRIHNCKICGAITTLLADREPLECGYKNEPWHKTIETLRTSLARVEGERDAAVKREKVWLGNYDSQLFRAAKWHTMTQDVVLGVVPRKVIMTIDDSIAAVCSKATRAEAAEQALKEAVDAAPEWIEVGDTGNWHCTFNCGTRWNDDEHGEARPHAPDCPRQKILGQYKRRVEEMRS